MADNDDNTEDNQDRPAAPGQAEVGTDEIGTDQVLDRVDCDQDEPAEDLDPVVNDPELPDDQAVGLPSDMAEPILPAAEIVDSGESPPSEPPDEATAEDDQGEIVAERAGEPSPGSAPADLPETEEDGPAAREDGDADADVETLEAPVGLGEPEVTTERVVEAVLFASDVPLPLSKIVSVLGVGSARDARNHIKALNEKYEQTGATFRIEQIASGYQMLTLPVYNTWIRRLKQSKQDSRLSQAAMETLAVVAYRQPVVRADIEAIRGVSAGEMLNRLRELGLIKIVGRAEDVGRPMLYGTTRRFLEVFGLSGLEDLPSVEEMQPGE